MALSYKDYRNIRPGDKGYTPEKAKARVKFSPTRQDTISIREFQKQAHTQAGTQRTPSKTPSKATSKTPLKSPKKTPLKTPLKVTPKVTPKTKRLTIEDKTGFRRIDPNKTMGPHPFKSPYYQDSSGNILSAGMAKKYSDGKITLREALLKSQKTKQGKEKEWVRVPDNEVLGVKGDSTNELVNKLQRLVTNPIISKDRLLLVKAYGEPFTKYEDEENKLVWRTLLPASSSVTYNDPGYWELVREEIKHFFIGDIYEIAAVLWTRQAPQKGDFKKKGR